MTFATFDLLRFAKMMVQFVIHFAQNWTTKWTIDDPVLYKLDHKLDHVGATWSSFAKVDHKVDHHRRDGPLCGPVWCKLDHVWSTLWSTLLQSGSQTGPYIL